MKKTIAETGGIADAIADIETRRLAAVNDAGMAMACSAALHRLQELLDHETEGLRLRGPTSAHLANVETVSTEIGRVKRLCVVTSNRSTRKSTSRARSEQADASAGQRHKSTKEDQI